jgi:hypothetical protein
VNDPCMKMTAPPCNMPPSPCNSGYMNQAPPPPAPSAATASGVPAGWRYCWDAQGNMHMWPENSQQGSSAPTTRCCYDSAGNMHVWPESPQSGSYMEGSMIDMSPKAGQYNIPAQYSSNAGDKLRSDSMGSWGSSTTCPSTASYINSSAESLRSESMNSSSGSSDATSRREAHMPRPKASFLGMFKEKLKSKPKGVVVPPKSSRFG